MEDLTRITDSLLLHGSLIESPGLLHGKMGITIFFFHYARSSGDSLYWEYAMLLLEKITQQLHASYRADYEKGIAGIGAGLCHLIGEHLVETERDLFEDLDERMVRAVLFDPWSGYGLPDGLTGLGRYWIMRLLMEPDNSQANHCLNYIVQQVGASSMHLSGFERECVKGFLLDLRTFFGWPVFEDFAASSVPVSEIPTNEEGLRDALKPLPPLGLLNGIAREGLCLLEREGMIQSSWRSLLLTQLSAST